MKKTVIDNIEVTDSKGTLALQVNGWDILYLVDVLHDKPQACPTCGHTDKTEQPHVLTYDERNAIHRAIRDALMGS